MNNKKKVLIATLLSIMMFTAVNSQDKSDNSKNYYQKSVKFIKKDKNFKNFTNYKGFVVSEDIIPIYHLKRYFTKELDINIITFNIETSKYNFIDDISIDTKLKKLSTQLDSELTLFFSEIEDKYFFIEIYQDTRKTRKYQTQPIFGESLAYLIKFDEDAKVVAVFCKKISHN